MSSKVVARRSNIHGTGVFARQDIKRGERIIEYKGLRRSHEDVDGDDAGDAESGHTFLFTLNEDWVIDGSHNGNVAKWINFSCRPNAEAVLEETEGKDRRRDRVFIEARRAISAGDELTYDYNITLDVPHTARLKKIWECRCGAKSCRGTMLKLKTPKKVAAKKAAVKKAAVKKTASKKTPAKKVAVRTTALKKTPAKKVAVRKTALKKTPAKKTAVTKIASKTGTARKIAVKTIGRKLALKAPAAKTSTGRTATKKAPVRKAPARKSAPR